MGTQPTIRAVVAGLLALGLAVPTTAVAQEAEPDVVGSSCREFVAWPEVSQTEAEKLVADDEFEARPDEFGSLEDPTDPDTKKLFITARRCKALTLFGQTEQDVIEAYIAVPVTPSYGDEFERPRDSGFGPLDANTAAGHAVPLESYLVQWITTSRRRAHWLRQHADLREGQVLVVDDLVFDYDPVPARVPGAVDDRFTVIVPHQHRHRSESTRG